MIVWIVEWSIIYRLIDVWDGVEQSVINDTIAWAVAQTYPRLQFEPEEILNILT